MVATFSNVWNANYGFTPEEAALKARRVNEAHGVGDPNSKWKPAIWVRDPHRKSGYMVTIETK